MVQFKNIWPRIPASPYISAGLLSRRNTTNITLDTYLIYARSSFPTPWPILVGGFLLSLITATFALLGGHQTDEIINYPKLLLSTAGLVISTIRSFLAFSTAIITLQNTSSRQARWQSSSALTCLFLSLLPTTWSYRFRVGRGFAWLSLLLVTITSGIVINGLVSNSPHDPYHYYAQWHLQGIHNNATLVSNCGDARSNSLMFGNTIAKAELFVQIPMWFLVCFGAMFAILSCAPLFALIPVIRWVCDRALRLRSASQPSKVFDKVLAEKRRKRSRKLNKCAIVGIVLVAVIMIPVHVVQEVKSRVFYVQEGDICFAAKTAVDHMGFMGTWWHEHRSNVLAILPMT